jgi:hypothetical protein
MAFDNAMYHSHHKQLIFNYFHYNIANISVYHVALRNLRYVLFVT